MKRCIHFVSLSCRIALLLILSAMYSYAQTGDIHDINILIEKLNNKSEAWSASVKLQEYGEEAVASLLSALKQNQSPDNSHIMAALIKIGPTAIPYVVDTFLSYPDKTDDISFENRSTAAYKHTLIKALAGLGPGAIPGLVRIAEASPISHYYGREYHKCAFQAILGSGYCVNSVKLSLNYYTEDPWYKTSPSSHEIKQRRNTVQPFLSRIHDLMLADHKHWQPQNAAPEIDAAFILALWGENELKQAGINMLIEMASTNDEPWYQHSDAIRELTSLGVQSASALLKSSLPPQDYDLYDQVLVSTAKQLQRIGNPDYYETILPAFHSKDLSARKDAFAFAEQSHDLRFIPVLIANLKDPTLTGIQHIVDREAQKQTIGDLALQTLQRLSFTSLPMDSTAWEAWWNDNSEATWNILLEKYIASCMESFDRTPVWQLNSRINELRHVDDSAVLPLLSRYIRHPLLDTHLTETGSTGTGPSLMWIEGYGTYEPFPWGEAPPTAVSILLGLAVQGNEESLHLLDACLVSHDRSVRIYGALALNRFDPERTIAALRQEANREESADTAVEFLVRLGDSQAIGALIEKLVSDVHENRDYRRQRDYELLLKYTQKNILYEPTMKQWRQWWEQHRNDFKSRLLQAETDNRGLFNITVSP